MFESFKASHQDPTILKKQATELKEELKPASRVKKIDSGSNLGAKMFGGLGLGTNPRTSVVAPESSDMDSPDRHRMDSKNFDLEESKRQTIEIQEMEERLTKNIDEKFSAILEMITQIQKDKKE